VALPPTILAIATLVSSSHHTAQGEKLIEKTEQVHVLVNSQMTQVKLDLVAANERIEKLQKLVEKLLEERAAIPTKP